MLRTAVSSRLVLAQGMLGASALLLSVAGCGSVSDPLGAGGSGGGNAQATTGAEVVAGNTSTGANATSTAAAGSAPTISSFVATPATVDAGASSTLSWSASDGALSIDGQLVTGTSLTVTPAATKTYTLTVTNAVGQATADATVTVNPSSVPTDPITFTKDTVFTINSGTKNWVYVPNSYDSSHQTPTTLLIWLHGCGGESAGDIYMVSPGGNQSWISLTVGGQEGNCWDTSNDPAHVLDALADIKTHFNIKPKGVILGGYSSGGDLTYRTAFYNASLFAGVIVENSSPYRDTGSHQADSLAAASWKFNVAHLAHLQDMTYGIQGVRTETDSLTAAGYPMTRIEKDGGHYDNPGAIENNHAVPGTSADLVTYLLPYMDAGWTAP